MDLNTHHVIIHAILFRLYPNASTEICKAGLWPPGPSRRSSVLLHLVQRVEDLLTRPLPCTQPTASTTPPIFMSARLALRGRQTGRSCRGSQAGASLGSAGDVRSVHFCFSVFSRNLDPQTPKHPQLGQHSTGLFHIFFTSFFLRLIVSVYWLFLCLASSVCRKAEVNDSEQEGA